MLVVQKFGGSSLADTKAIKKIARRIREYKNIGGIDLVIVVSAMGDTTDDLITLANEITPNVSKRELDMLLTCGERISMSLLSMALNSLGLKAESFTGSQSGIITSEKHTSANIIEMKPLRIADSLKKGIIPVVAGFQGVSKKSKEITTIGRGGSDITALALASSLNASICEIYTDVDGVFWANPTIVPFAKQYNAINYDFMLKMAENGANVLHPKSVEFAQKFNVPIHVRSSFTDRIGTFVGVKKGKEYIIAPNESFLIESIENNPVGITFLPNTDSNTVKVAIIKNTKVEYKIVKKNNLDKTINKLYKNLVK
jgi:aspartate kinase